jgi:hypothetical protein
MSKTTQERVKDWREKKAREVGRSLAVWLEPSTTKQLKFLQEEFPKETNASLVAKAIKNQYRVTRDQKAGRGKEEWFTVSERRLSRTFEFSGRQKRTL